VVVVAMVEEFGVYCLGAKTAAESIDPQLGVAIDVTHGDMPGVKEGETYALGSGPAICVGGNIHPLVFEGMKASARALGIPYSVEGCPITSATDAMDIQIAREGVPTGVIGIPCRYMHTAIETVAPEDVDRCARVLARFVGDLEPSWRRGGDWRAHPSRRALLGRLSEASGVSGGEEAVRRILIDEVRDHVDSLEIDALGNLVARIAPAPPRSSRSNGSRRPRRGPHVLLCAHMDEVGLMVFAIEKDGRVRVRRVGGIDQRILVGQVFRVGASGIRGVLGALPPHLVAKPEREKVIPIDEMYLDIGASTRDETERHVAVGDYACFDTTYDEWGSTRKGKAFDDRGCTVPRAREAETPRP
jgi:putative aminopeptidase FrvX